MTYEQALEKIHSLLTFGSRPGLDRMRALLELMGNPQDKLRFIHVAGTNGKGSVCALISSALTAAGFKTGLFISPYIIDFRERIQINNRMIEKSELASAVEETFPLIEKLRAEGTVITEFEYVNALEFYIHANSGCEVVVLETGMGGLLDCTNVIKPPLCSVITVIGLDHIAVLGDTIEKIAEQKCGIIKSGSLCVTSAQDERAEKVIEESAARKNVPLFRSSDIKIKTVKSDLGGSEFEYCGNTFSIGLAGEHQLENAKTALAALEALRRGNLLSISLRQIADGFAKAENPARLELLSRNPEIILDGAHNLNGAAALAKALKSFLPNRKIVGIIGMLADKDTDGALGALEGCFYKVYTVPVNNPRTETAEALAAKCSKYFESAAAFGSVKDAIVSALDSAKRENAAIVICGSLYLAAEARRFITLRGFF